MLRLIDGLGRAGGAMILAAALTGCVTVEGYPKDPQSTQTLSALQSRYFSATSEDRYVSASTDQRQAIRDEIVLGRMRTYDIEFSRFERALSANGGYLSLGGDLAGLVLGGLGATTGSTATKSALSAASGGIIGAQGVVNKDLFYQKTVPALIAQMQANRASVKLTIYKGLALPDSLYPLGRADMDLAELNDSGSLPNAISNVTQSAANQVTETNLQISLHQMTYANTSSAKSIRAWLFQDGAIHQDRMDKLQSWLTNNSDTSLHGLLAAQLAEGDGVGQGGSVAASILEQARLKALQDLTLGIPH